MYLPRRRKRRRAYLRLSERLFGALLKLYPPSLRRAYGEDMRQLFRDSVRDELARSGPPGALTALVSALGDLAASAPREWSREMRRIHRPRGAPRLGIPRLIVGRAPSHVIPRGQFREPRHAMEEKFEKFTERARKVLSLAQEEAQRFNHNYIGTEHLLLGLVREGDGVAAKVLMHLGVELDKARSAVEFIIGRGDRIVLGEVGLTPRAKKVIELAVDEARRLNHHYVGTEHLLLGLIREGEGIAAGVLESLGVNLEKVRRATIEVLSGGAVGAPGSWTPGATGRSRSRPRPDLGKFTDQARRIIRDTLVEARERDQREAGTGHTLLALLAEEDGAAAWALRESGVNLEAARQAVERELGPRPTPGATSANGPVTLGADSLRMIALAADEASAMNDRFVGSEHLLLGILREGEGVGAQVLLTLVGDVESLRRIATQRHTQMSSALERRPSLWRLTLTCRDLAATAGFYMQQLGAIGGHGQGGQEGDRWRLRLPGGGPLLVLRAVKGDPDTAVGPANIELDIWVADIALMWRTLKDANAPALSDISDGSDGRAFTVADPDGRLLRIYAQRDHDDA